MKREWKYYHNSQKYSECQLVSALNALYYLSGKYIKQDSQEYEYLVDLVFARNSAAISIKKAYKLLGLKSKEHKNYIPIFEKETKLPIEVSVWEKHYGFHSVCIVNICQKAG